MDSGFTQVLIVTYFIVDEFDTTTGTINSRVFAGKKLFRFQNYATSVGAGVAKSEFEKAQLQLPEGFDGVK